MKCTVIIWFCCNNICFSGGAQCGGVTPLHDAAQWGHTEIVKFLIEKGANVLAKDDDGKTALDTVESLLNNNPNDSCDSDRRRIVDLLEEASRNPRKIAKPKMLTNDDLYCTGESKVISKNKTIIDYASYDVPTIVDDIPKKKYKKQSTKNIISHYSNYQGKSTTNTSIKNSSSTSKYGNSKRKQPQESTLSRKSKRSKQSRILEFADDSSPPENLPTDVSNEQNDCNKLVCDSSSTALKPSLSLHDNAPSVSPVTVTRVKIKIRDKLFLIPVLPNQTIADITTIAAQRYHSFTGLLPKLSLTTTEGAILNSDDVCSLLLKDCEELLGSITESSQESVCDKYLQTCKKFNVNPVFKDSISAHKVQLGRRSGSLSEFEALMSCLLCCTSLVKLDISWFRLCSNSMLTLTNTLGTLTSLKYLNLKCTSLNDTKLSKISDVLKQSLPLLEALIVDNNKLSFIPVLECILEIKTLKIFSGRCCGFAQNKAVSDEISFKFKQSNLQEMDLSGNKILHFPALPPSLKTVKLGGSDVFVNNTLDLPAGVKKLTLQNICLSKNTLDRLRHLRSLEYCDISHNKLTSDGLVDLLMMFPSLTFLDVSSNPIQLAGIEELGLIAPLTLSVRAYNCIMRDTPSSRVQVSPDLITTLSDSLKSIDLSYNSIDYPHISKELPDIMKSKILCANNILVINAQ